AGADFLFVLPAPGVEGAALAEGLAALGLEVTGETRAGGLRVRVEAGADAGALADRVAASGLARSVEGDQVVRATGEPADPLYAFGQHRYLHIIRAPEAWARQTGDSSVVVAVVDTGVDWDHPDLSDRIFV